MGLRNEADQIRQRHRRRDRQRRNLVAVACFVNTSPYELIVQESIKSKEQLKGKSIGISRIGSSSDVAARVLLKGLGLEPDKDVPIIQVGGSSERAAAFRSGKIAGFPRAAWCHPLGEGPAASGSHQHRGFSQVLSVSLYLRDDDQELSGEQSTRRQKAVDGAHGRGALFQNAQGRKQKDHNELHPPERRVLSRSGTTSMRGWSSGSRRSAAKEWTFNSRKRSRANQASISKSMTSSTIRSSPSWKRKASSTKFSSPSAGRGSVERSAPQLIEEA